MPRRIHSLMQPIIHGRFVLLAVMVLMIWQVPTSGRAAVTAGGIAILGYRDNTDAAAAYSPFDTVDTFSIAALEQINSGTILYFTDNGWDSGANFGAGAFSGATALDGDGNETLIKLTFTSNVAAGTIMRSGTNGSGFIWQMSGIIPGTSESFSELGLAATTGEQIYAFEAGGNPPLYNPTNHVFVLDMGDFNNQGFENASNERTGNITPGLSIVANTAVTLPDVDAGDDANDFHNGSFALNMDDSDVDALTISGGTKAQWLAVIANSDNWLRINYLDDAFGDAEGQLFTLNIAPVPEPTRGLFLALGAFGMVLRRRRKKV